jgi:diguanylate cyclase (GGDEF)-like protein
VDSPHEGAPAATPPAGSQSEETAQPPDGAAREPVEPTPNRRLGDLDLVDAILEGPGSLEETALELLIQETGWSDAVLLPHDSAPVGVPAAEVAWRGDRFGLLCTRSATESELVRWAEWLARWLALAHKQARLEEFAFTDPLTGAWNRRYFDAFLRQTIDDARKARRAVTLMVFDVDDLKRYNDAYGHEAGDQALRETARALQSVVRKTDRVCRIGGDEFVIVFPHRDGPRRAGSTPLESVDVIFQRVCAIIRECRFPQLGCEAPGTLTISAGAAMFPWDGHDAETLLRHADRLAIESKRKGKDALTLGPGAAEYDRRPADEGMDPSACDD